MKILMTPAQKRFNQYLRAQKGERGVGMISVLLGMVILAVLVVAIFNQFSDAQRSARIEEAKSQIATVISNAQRSYGSARQYGAVTTALAINGGAIPAHMRVGAGAQNVYDGAVGLVSQTIVAAGDGLRLTYPTDPADCQEIVLSSLPITRRITVGTTVVRATDAQINMATLNTACNVTTPTVDVQLDFGFR